MAAQHPQEIDQTRSYLHVFNKGVSNSEIFKSKEDYDVFINYLQEYLSKPADPTHKKKSFTVNGRTYMGTPHQPKNYFGEVELLAYSITPSHFHLLVSQTSKKSLENFLRSLCTRYSIYFNKKYSRKGALFQGPYKSIAVKEVALPHLVAYLHKKHIANGRTTTDQYKGNTRINWIKSEVIETIYSAANPDSKQPHNFVDFAEKFVYSDAEKAILSSYISEDCPEKAPTLEKSFKTTDLSSRPTKKSPTTRPLRIPEYLFLTFSFFLLAGIGYRNINIDGGLEPLRFTTKKVVDVNNVKEISQTTSLVQTQTPAETIYTEDINRKESVLAASESAEIIEPKNIPYSLVTLIDGVSSADIYKDPSLESEIIMTFYSGDQLVAMPIDTEWYEIRFSDNTHAYIEAKNVRLVELKETI